MQFWKDSRPGHGGQSQAEGDERVSTQSRSRGGRPRDASLDARILKQAFTLLAAKGFGGLRADDVARCAGVPKSTIYRRWSSLAELAVDAVDAAMGPRECEAGADPLADLTEIIVKAHSYLVASPLAPALPRLRDRKSVV